MLMIKFINVTLAFEDLGPSLISPPFPAFPPLYYQAPDCNRDPTLPWLAQH